MEAAKSRSLFCCLMRSSFSFNNVNILQHIPLCGYCKCNKGFGIKIAGLFMAYLKGDKSNCRKHYSPDLFCIQTIAYFFFTSA